MAKFEEQQLQRLSQVKKIHHADGAALGPELLGFFRQSVQKRHAKLSKIAACWEQLIPSTLVNHCSLETFSRGTLTVLVDSSSHLYELKHLLLAGLQKQILMACKQEGLRKIALKHGRWYEGNNPTTGKLRF